MKKEDRFKVGDIVKLKSGGPEMTVQSIHEGSNNYRCQWFAGKNLRQGSSMLIPWKLSKRKVLNGHQRSSRMDA